MEAACCHCGDETGKAESRAWGCRRERARNRGQYQRRERGMACGGCSATDVVVVVLQQAGRRCCCSPVDTGVESLGLVTRTDTHLSTPHLQRVGNSRWDEPQASTPEAHHHHSSLHPASASFHIPRSSRAAGHPQTQSLHCATSCANSQHARLPFCTIMTTRPSRLQA
jgi:hypothetical protein